MFRAIFMFARKMCKSEVSTQCKKRYQDETV